MARSYRDPIRHFNYTVTVGYNMLQLIAKGEDVEGKDVAKRGIITAAQLSAIYFSDKLIHAIVSRGYLKYATYTLAGIYAIYIGGAVVSTIIDPDHGFERYNDYIDDVTSGDIDDALDKVSWATNYLIYDSIMDFLGSDTGNAVSLVIKELERRVLGPLGLN